MTIAALAAGVALLALGGPAVAQSDPATPRNLTAEIDDGEGVVLNWDSPGEDAESVTGYQVLRRRPLSREKNLLVYVADTGSTATTYTDGEATVAGERYVYRVKALRGGEASKWSNFARVDLPRPTATPTPSAWQLRPLALEATVGAGFVTLAWKPPAYEAESVNGYEVLRRRTNRGERTLMTLVADTGSTDTAYRDGTANEEGVKYAYRVKALRGGEASVWSNFANATGRAAETLETTSGGTVRVAPAQGSAPDTPDTPTGKVIFRGGG